MPGHEKEFYEFYRASSYNLLPFPPFLRLSNRCMHALTKRDRIGAMLLDSLDEFIYEGSLTPQLALIIVKNFDKTIAEVLEGAVDRNMTFMVCP